MVKNVKFWIFLDTIQNYVFVKLYSQIHSIFFYECSVTVGTDVRCSSLLHIGYHCSWWNGEIMNWKDFKAIRYGVVKVLAWHLLGGTETSPPPFSVSCCLKNHSHNNWYSSKYLYGHLLNTSIEQYCYTKLLGLLVWTGLNQD